MSAIASSGALDRELATYDRYRGELLGRAEGKFVLIHADQVIEIFATRDDAIAAGYKSLGNTPFLVKQVLAVEVPENLVSNQIAIWDGEVPSFTVGLGPNLQPAGPVIEMMVAVPDALEQELRANAQTVPNPIQVVAMIDTGASATVLQQGLASQLGIKPVGVVSINTPSSTGVQCYQFAVRLLFPNNVVVGGTVIEAPLQGQHIQCLIGRDVLAHGVLVYIGYTGQFTLSF